MDYKDFEGLWRVTGSAPEAKCQKDSIITFFRADTGKKEVTVLCAQLPYDESTGSYKPDNTIEVKIGEDTYVIRMEKPGQITFGPKEQISGALTGSWTAEDYVPAPPPPTGK